MLTKREKKLSIVMIFIQVLLSVLVFDLLEHFFPPQPVELPDKLFFVSQILIIWTFLFYKFRLGIIYRTTSFVSMIRGYIVTISIAGILLLIELRLMILIGSFSYSAYFIFWFCIIDLVILTIFKFVFYHVMRSLRREGRNSRNVVIIADSKSKGFINAFLKSKDWGYNIRAVLTPDTDFPKLKVKIVVVDGQNDVFKKILLKGIDDIFYCLPVTNNIFNADEIVTEAEELGISVHIMQEEHYGSVNSKNIGNKYFENVFVTYQTTPAKYVSLKFKELFDIFFSALVLVLTSPLMLVITLLVYFEDRGPIFFKQERIGLNGRRFICFKFRSMVPNAETLLEQLKDKNESDGPTFKIENDPRVTKIGRFLRKTSLDEFPQFYNVIRGEMSIVGPRPPLLKEVMQYEKYQLRRLSMKPGITCIWQVSGRNSISFVEWMKMDLDYIDNWSLKMDLKIILKTVGVVFRANGQ